MTEEAKPGAVRNDTAAKRFESEVNGELAVSVHPGHQEYQDLVDADTG